MRARTLLIAATVTLWIVVIYMLIGTYVRLDLLGL